ncbi:MAG: TolC family protein [Crocinitomicaceae bacterium]|nr:TolC family protein [Crocinitomicaceae bacterium]
MKCFIVITLLLCSRLVFGSDTLVTVTYDEFIEQVIKNHPVAFQASIKQKIGESNLTESKGAFDPKFFGNINQKYFGDKQYYSHLNSGIKIPTWFGLSAEAGYSVNEGVFLNPESRMPDAGLWYAGLRLELGNGLIIDQRRAEFEKAKLFLNSSEIERLGILNQLKRDASIAYWEWLKSYQELVVYQEAYENALARFEALKSTVLFGDRPAIDTVEASIALQSRSLSLLRSQTKLENAELNIELYLWDRGFVPLEIENVTPELNSSAAEYISLSKMDTLMKNHPYLQMNDLKSEMLKIDVQLKKEQLKPNLTLKYNALSEPINSNPIAEYALSNYTWGATFSYPMLTRKERGGLKQAKLKLNDQELKNTMFSAELKYKVKSTLNNYTFSIEQAEINGKIVRSNQKLYNAEQTLFNLGESSVFMINSRENTWLKTQINAIKSDIEVRKMKTEIDYLLFIL